MDYRWSADSHQLSLGALHRWIGALILEQKSAHYCNDGKTVQRYVPATKAFLNCTEPLFFSVLTLFLELTIVGLWSVFLFLLTSTFGVKNETLKHVFELIHISLFGLLLIYIGVMIFMALLSLVMFRRFHMLEELDERKSESLLPPNPFCVLVTCCF